MALAKPNYTIKKGDSLSAIAKKHGLKSWKQIYDAPENKTFKKDNPDPNKINPGDKIFVPPSSKTIKSYYKKDMPRMSYEIFGDKALIFVQQRWTYVYQSAAGCSKWESKEKTKFHNELDKAIWAKWSGAFKVQVSGTSDFAKVFKDTVFKLNFDIKRVSSKAHWTVTATKIKKGDFETSSVNWSKQTIKLDTEDTKLTKKQTEDGKDTGSHKPVNHEFGHAVGDNPDEYKTASPHRKQIKSLMNVGSQLKKRHADHVMEELSKMIPNTKFTVKSVG